MASFVWLNLVVFARFGVLESLKRFIILSQVGSEGYTLTQRNRMSDKIEQLMVELDSWFKKEDAIPIVNLGATCGMLSVRNLITRTRQDIMLIAGLEDEADEFDDERLVRAMAVSDTLSAIIDSLDRLITLHMEDVPMDNEDILLLVKALSPIE
jgi:hypothetical protein